MLWYIGTRAIAEAPQHLAIPASLKIFFRKRSLAVADDPRALWDPQASLWVTLLGLPKSLRRGLIGARTPPLDMVH